MKTDTRDRILKIIDTGKARPFDLRKALGISAQALHRHLRNLTRQGMIETEGSPPLVYYKLTGLPSFERAAKWLNAQTVPKSHESFWCQTREIFTARLSHLKSFVKNGLSENLLPLVVSTAGEIGNNS